jgi:uncharacterized Tic20 family protein
MNSLTLALTKEAVMAETTPNEDARNLATLAHLLGIFTSFVAPLVIWLTKKDSDPFVESQSKEALNFQITAAIAHLANGIAGIVLILVWWLVGWAVSLAITGIMIWWSVLAVQATNKGEAYRYPFNLRFIR